MAAAKATVSSAAPAPAATAATAATAAPATRVAAANIASANDPPGFESLRPLSPLPLPYVQHLAYMAKHPQNRPDPSVANRGAWMSPVRGYERGKSTRNAELEAIMQQSGWNEGDSPMGVLPPPAGRAVLTGNAWHWGQGNCPASCSINGGVCLPTLGRCDCPRHRWGPACEWAVEPAVSRTQLHHGWCVYNDSSPFFCDRPLCENRRGEAFRSGLNFAGTAACVGDPLSSCPSKCSHRGTCRGGRCQCIPGYSGRACESSIRFFCVSNCLGRGKCELGFCRCEPPYYGVDCSLQLPPHTARPLPVGHLGLAAPPVDTTGGASGASMSSGGGGGGRHACLRPCIYVYELPARFNVLALKAEPHWPFYEHGPADYRAFKAVHISLLRSAHRTTDPQRADFFYVPTWDLHGSWGNPELYWRAQRYIASVLPFWNRTQGADHIWTNTRDAGGCSNPWGSIWDQVGSNPWSQPPTPIQPHPTPVQAQPRSNPSPPPPRTLTLTPPMG